MEENSLIIKKTLHHGSKSVQFKNGTKVYFHFVTKVTGNAEKILDDSRKMGSGKPMELVLGKKFKLEVWEAIVQKLALNEVAQFTVDKSLVMHYPFVSKTLRDINKPKSEPAHHCCAMTLASEGVGYEDLNEFLKNPSNLDFIIELVKVEQPEDYEKEVWQMGENERVEMIPKLKDDGNREYKNKNYDKATEHYAKAIGLLEQLMLKEKPHDEEWNVLNQQKLPLLLNFAQCKLLQNDFYPVIEHCTEVINSDPSCVKAYFRRGKAHVGAWNVEEARKDFHKVLELDQSLEALVKKELKALDELVKKKDEEDKKSLKNLFKS